MMAPTRDLFFSVVETIEVCLLAAYKWAYQGSPIAIQCANRFIIPLDKHPETPNSR